MSSIDISSLVLALLLDHDLLRCHLLDEGHAWDEVTTIASRSSSSCLSDLSRPAIVGLRLDYHLLHFRLLFLGLQVFNDFLADFHLKIAWDLNSADGTPRQILT